MNGAEHFKKAERLMAQARTQDRQDAARTMAAAQVHATLAQAAATIAPMFTYPQDDGSTATYVDDSWNVIDDD